MPRIVTALKQAGLQDGHNAANAEGERAKRFADIGVNDGTVPMQMGFGNNSTFMVWEGKTPTPT